MEQIKRRQLGADAWRAILEHFASSGLIRRSEEGVSGTDVQCLRWTSILAKEAYHLNVTSDKILLTPEGELELSIPRIRHGRFDPALIGKYQRRFPRFDDEVIPLYARRMST
jgi:hypothetical protein